MNYLTALRRWWQELTWLERFLAVWIVVIVVGRWVNLTSPQAVVFDEVYFPKMASQYLAGESFFDIHPPLGKLLIALGIQSFGDNYLGWRVVPAIFGSLLPLFAYRLIRVWSGSRMMGLLLALFLVTDGLFVVYARLGLMDEIMIVFGLLALIFSGQYWRTGRPTELIWAGLALGATISVKWIGAGFWPLVLLPVLWRWRQERTRFWPTLGQLVLGLGLIPLTIYVASFSFNWSNNFWSSLWQWHLDSFGYNIHLDATHPFYSVWWSWPIMLRPIWFYHQVVAEQVYGITAMGHPLWLYSSTLAVVVASLMVLYGWFKREPSGLSPLSSLALIGFYALWLPWAAVSRVLFFYHYLAAYTLALIILAEFISRLASLPGRWRGGRWRGLAPLYLGVGLAIFILFYPIWVGKAVSQAQFKRLMWLPGWDLINYSFKD